MIDLKNVNLMEAEQAAYAAGDTLKAKLLARILDLEDELARVKYAAADDSLTAWESAPTQPSQSLCHKGVLRN